MAKTPSTPSSSMGERATDMALDVAGTADPTGVVDIAHAADLARRGRYVDAGLTALGVVPLVGDAAKLLKYGKMARNIPGAGHVVDKIDGKIDGQVQNMAQSGGGLVTPGGLAGWRAGRELAAAGPTTAPPTRRMGG
jgi:hypothetical protein